MFKALTLIALLNAPEPRNHDHWFGADKVKHFLMSAFIQSGAFSAARAAGSSRPNAQIMAGVSSFTFAVGKEAFDRRRGRPFSVKDRVWDGGGALTAAALLNGTR